MILVAEVSVDIATGSSAIVVVVAVPGRNRTLFHGSRKVQTECR